MVVQTHTPARACDAHEQAREAMRAVAGRNPDFEHAYYGAAAALEYVRREMPSALPAYLALGEGNPQARADLFRYVRIYRDGGVYLDSTVCLARPLTEIVALGQRGDVSRAVLAHWGPPGDDPSRRPYCPHARLKGVPALGEFVIFFLIAPPRHPLLLRVVERVVAEVEAQLRLPAEKRARGKGGVLRITGPIAFTKEAQRFIEDGGGGALAIHDSVERLGIKCHSEWPRVKWATPHRKESGHYSNNKFPVVV